MDYFSFTQHFPCRFLNMILHTSEGIRSSRMSFLTNFKYLTASVFFNSAVMGSDYIPTFYIDGEWNIIMKQYYYCWQSVDFCGFLSFKTWTSQPWTDQRHQHPWATHWTLPGQCCSSTGALIRLQFVLITSHQIANWCPELYSPYLFWISHKCLFYLDNVVFWLHGVCGFISANACITHLFITYCICLFHCCQAIQDIVGI